MEVVIVACFIFTMQSILGFMQINYYRRYINKITERYANSENYHLYSAMQRKRFGSSAIAVIIVDKNNIVKECQILQGKSVFAKFKLFAQFHEQGLSEILEELEKNKMVRKLFIWEEALIKTAKQRLMI